VKTLIPISPISNSEESSSLPHLQKHIYSVDRQIVDTSTDVWRLRSSADGGKEISINWKLLEGSPRVVFSPRAITLIKLYLADKIAINKAWTVQNAYQTFTNLNRWLSHQKDSSSSKSLLSRSFNWSDMTEGMARAFLSYCVRRTAEKGNGFSRLRTFYEWGVARQYPDFSMILLQCLQSIKAPGNSKGHSVRFRDPVKGPLSPEEKLLIGRAIEAGAGADQDRAVVMLHLEIGMNANASARLRNKDIKRYEAAGEVIYQLDVPRVKKRITKRETKRRPVTRKLGDLLLSLQSGDAEDRLLHWLSRTYPESSINEAMKRFVRQAKIISPRTNERLELTSRRFRYSLATDLAEEGASAIQIAEALDHTDTQHVRVYTETVSSITDQVAKATDQYLVPLVRRFQGKIVGSEQQPAFEDLPNQMIPASAPHLPFPLLDAAGVGMCGRNPVTHGLCRLFPPLTCYTCPSFAALRGGPHQQLLDSIERFINDRKEHMDERTAVQLTDIQCAIKEVLAQIEPSLQRRNKIDSRTTGDQA
jgi:integrase